MGMSASQARFLILTGQKNNNEYQAQRITYERLVLSANTQQWMEEYNDQISNRSLLFGQSNAEVVNYNRRLTYKDIVTLKEDGGLDMRLVTTSGKIVVPELPEPLPQGYSAKDYFVDPEINKPSMLDSALRNNVYFLEKPTIIDDEYTDGQEIHWEKKNWQEISEIADVLDTTDDAEAQALYDKRMSQFQQADKQLEMRQKQLETEHTALETEIDSVKKVVDKNIETSFKTFG